MSLEVTPLASLVKEPFAICHEVFGPERLLSKAIARVVASYLGPEMGQIYSSRFPYFDPHFDPLDRFPAFTDLTNKDTLCRLLPAQFREKTLSKETSQALACAQIVAKQIYDACPRIIRDANVGAALTTEAEILAHAMQEAPGKTFLEIAGARGEHAILMAIAGAKMAYLNDKTPGEIQAFQRTTTSLPGTIQARLQAVPGDCLKVLKAPPWTPGTIDFALCRNFIHLLTDAEQAVLFPLLTNSLAEGAKLIVVANSLYSPGQCYPDLDPEPRATSFYYRRCFYTEPDLNFVDLYRELIPCSSDGLSTYSKIFKLYTKNESTGNQWVFHEENFAQFSEEFCQAVGKIHAAMERQRATLESLPKAGIFARVTVVRLYSPASLTELLSSYGFDVESTFVTDMNGHRIEEGGDLFARGRQVGAVARFRGKPKK